MMGVENLQDFGKKVPSFSCTGPYSPNLRQFHSFWGPSRDSLGKIVLNWELVPIKVRLISKLLF